MRFGRSFLEGFLRILDFDRLGFVFLAELRFRCLIDLGSGGISFIIDFREDLKSEKTIKRKKIKVIKTMAKTMYFKSDSPFFKYYNMRVYYVEAFSLYIIYHKNLSTNS